MARKNKSYKLVNVATKNLGGSGDQIRIGEVDKLDAQGINGFLNNIRLSVLLNDDSGGGYIGGFIAYLTTSSTWSDDYVITARAGNFGDTVNLVGKRRIIRNSDGATSNDGLVHLWLELTDIETLGSSDVRYVAETWGRFIAYTEV